MTTSTKTARARYLDGEISFREFYAPIAKALGVRIPESIMARVRQCRERSAFDGGQHLTLNEIPLSVWDAMGRHRDADAQNAFKAQGDFWSLAGMVCALKTQALLQLESEQAQGVDRG